MDLTLDDAKTAARALRRALAAADVTISHSRALEIVATQLGFVDWDTVSAQLSARPAGFGPTVPVLRVHDEARAREFYLDYLGFSVEWEHRFEPDMPLYLRVRRGQAVPAAAAEPVARREQRVIVASGRVCAGGVPSKCGWPWW